MNVDIESADIPWEVRELLRLQNQQIMRLQGALDELIDVLSGSEIGPSAVIDNIRTLASGERQQRLLHQVLKEAGWGARDDEWTRMDEPGWVWEGLAEKEAEAVWKAEHPLHP